MAVSRSMCEYQDLTWDLLRSEEVCSMGQWRHHGRVTCLDHCVLVSYLSFRAARALHLDARAAARGGLLHDLYLYDPRTRSPLRQCLTHGGIAADNASRLTDLSKKERNIILSHMWPLGFVLPGSPEAWLVDLVDDLCTGLEYGHLCRPDRLRKRLGVKGKELLEEK